MSNTRYVNDMIIRLANLKWAIAKLDSNQLDLSDDHHDTAWQSLVDEYKKTHAMLREELDQANAQFKSEAKPRVKPMPPTQI